MNLNNFEKTVEPTILARGFDYYENDYVTDIDQVEKGEFCATVEGTEEYTVLIKLDKDLNIKEHTCDCPYDWGDVCKHEVAVLYYIKDSELYDQPLEKSIFHKIKQDLEKKNKGELIEIIIGMSKRKKEIKEELMWELGYDLD